MRSTLLDPDPCIRERSYDGRPALGLQEGGYKPGVGVLSIADGYMPGVAETLVDEIVAEGGGLARVGVHQLVAGVDTIGNFQHGTEWEVGLNPRSAVHPCADFVVESGDLRARSLTTTAEVLISVFSDPDWFLEFIIKFGDVFDELIGISSIPMKSQNINFAAITFLEEFLHPSEAGRSGRRSGGDKLSVSLVLQGINVFLP